MSDPKSEIFQIQDALKKAKSLKIAQVFCIIATILLLIFLTIFTIILIGYFQNSNNTNNSQASVNNLVVTILTLTFFGILISFFASICFIVSLVYLILVLVKVAKLDPKYSKGFTDKGGKMLIAGFFVQVIVPLIGANAIIKELKESQALLEKQENMIVL